MKHRQYLTYLIIVVFAGMFSCANPTSSTGSAYTVNLTGTVVNLVGTQLDSVSMIVWIPFSKDTAKNNGTFSINFQASDKTTIADSITFSRSGFYSTTKYFSYSSSANTINLSAVVLKGLTPGNDSSKSGGQVSQRAGQIVFIGSTADNLSILGAGGVNACTLTFEVRDSLSVPVDTANQVNVNFRFVNQPDAQTLLSRDSIHTNSSGQVTVLLTSGLKAGLASVQATAAVKDKINPAIYDTIRSQIVSIPIYGGYPDSSHFSIGSTLLNVPGGVIINFQDKISVLVGDKYGNPVHPGTPVYFSSTGGSIEGEGQTDNDGIASVTLFTGNPVPSNGFAIVTAQVATSQTAGGSTSESNSPYVENSKKGASRFILAKASIPKPLSNHAAKFKAQKVIAGPLLSDSMPILFSGRTTLGSSNNNFTIPVGSATQVNFTVSDAIGNPLMSGSTIQVTASGPASSFVTMTGDASVTIPDTQDKRFAQFQVSLKDNRTTNLNVASGLTLTIVVTSQNGNSKMILTGTLAGTSGGFGVDSTIVSRITLLNPSPDSIFVAGVGGTNTDVVKFKVYNTFGQPDKNILVTFKMPLTLGGGEYLSPGTALTDTGGNVSTTLTSGTKYGEVLVTASTTKDSLTLTSDPKVVYIVIPPSARLASQVQYLGATATDIFVDGVGALENSTISYQVTDSLGFPIDRQRRVGVSYNVQFFPNSTVGGGTPPSVIPSTDSTDDSGLLHTSVVSGTEAGVIQVVAHINVPGRATLISQPVKITVHAGFPDQPHFTLSPSHFVFAGLDYENTIPFSVTVGDTFSNPVAKGTAVYFHSQAGVIETGNSDFSAYTDASGRASVNLLTANPKPLNAPYDYTAGSGQYAGIGGRPGYFWIYAQTQGHFATNVIDSVLVLAAGGPITFTGIPAGIVVIDSITQQSAPISITVKDGNGNPLPDGTTIVANIVPPANTLSGFQMGVSGDISSDLAVTLPDAGYARFPGPGITDFTFRVVNESVPASVASGVAVVVRITVTANAPYLWTSTFSFTAKAP